MAVYNLGQAAIVSKGDYSASTAYRPLNVVSHLGGSFMCITACTGVEPGVSSGWESYWQSTARGIQSYSVSVSGTTATVNIVYTDGGTYSTTYTTAAIGTGDVGTDNIAALAVTTTKIAGSAVTAAKIADGAVTLAKIANVNTSGYPWRIYVTTTAPTASSAHGIYLVYK